VEIAPGWWQACEGGRAARCALCFHRCRIPDGGMGLCGVRGYSGGVFSSPYLGRFASAGIDPIEKKPLHHWRPGTFILSLGSVGCNMRCPFCQNHRIARPTTPPFLTEITPAHLLADARAARVKAVAYTYNEPTLQAEYIAEAAHVLRDAGIASVLVTNGMMSSEALGELAPLVEAANVDVKTFGEATYNKLGGSLGVVKANVESLFRAGVHVELTNLVVPGVSDAPEDFERMVSWIASISPDIPLHISRYFPADRFTAPPTDVSLLRRFRGIADSELRFVHLGNV